MATTVVHLEADTVEVNDQPRYRLYASCIEQGDLQDIFMFLMEIVAQTLPEDDVFTRVLNVTDLDADIGFPSGRDTAIAAGKNFYRANEFTKYYDNVDLAANAKRVVQDEINRYVNEYVTYSTQFETSGEDVSFPTAEEAIADALKTAYDTSLVAYDAALTAQQAASVALTDAQDAYDAAVTWVAKRDTLSVELDKREAEMYGAQKLYSTFLSGAEGKAEWFHTQVKAFLNAYALAYPSGTNPLDADRNALESDAQDFLESITSAVAADINGTIQTGVNEHISMAATPDSYYIADYLDTLTKQSAVATAQTTNVVAGATVTAKYALVEAAYAAVKAVCPDWIPDTPLPALPLT